MKKIIITGSSGFIGKHLIEHLKVGYEVIAIDKNEENREEDGVRYIRNDITHPEFKEDLGEIYALIHLAGIAGVRKSRENFQEYVNSNIIGTKNLLELCVEKWKPQKIFLASSSSVHDLKSPYAVTKKCTEDLLKSYHRNGLLSDVECRVMRFYTVYGPNQRKGLAIQAFIDKVLRDEPIVINGDGFQSRDFTYIDDLCSEIQELLGMYPTRGYKTLEMGHGCSYSLYEVINIIGEITGKEIKIKYAEPSRYDAIITRAPYDGLYENTKLREGIRKQIEWTKEHLTSQ